MGKDEAICIDPMIADVEQIDVDGAWRILWALIGSSQGVLDGLSRVEQVKGRAIGLEFHHGIEKGRRTGGTANGFRFENRRNQEIFSGAFVKGPQALARLPQVIEAITDV